VVTAGQDRAFMERALFHAARGLGRTSPNPVVGAVVVSRDGVVVGQGAHLGAGGPHAEVVALDEAGALARDATIYCTLEPCSHHGRTGPCAQRIVAAGVRRAVIAVGDPNPLVSGRGFAYLRTHGVEVVKGIAAEVATRQLNPFFTWVTQARPFVILKSAVSRDGFVGRSTERVRLTGDVADRHFQRQRAAIDAIAVGAGTVLVDDPVLTARSVYRFRPLSRVVFDWRGRVPGTARVFSTLQAGPVIMVMSEEAARTAAATDLGRRGVTIEAFEDRDLTSVLRRLAAHDIVTLLVEGGPTLQRGFLDARLVDRLQWIQTPATLGHGVPVAMSVPEDGLRRPLGDDLLVEMDVHGTH
jgi:diaminohydroxyphosphoribosylaminopyrimidine deaminase/5-amino-6-(5-phosphoribosylamino)uracil reductase